MVGLEDWMRGILDFGVRIAPWNRESIQWDDKSYIRSPVSGNNDDNIEKLEDLHKS